MNANKLLDMLKKAYGSQSIQLEEKPPTSWRKNRQLAGGKTATNNNRYNKKEIISIVYGDPNFIKFWDVYPHKTAKQEAAISFYKVPPAEISQVLAGAEKRAAKRTAEETETQYIPYPATWLNNSRRADEVKINPKKAKKTASNAHVQDTPATPIQEVTLDDL